MKNNMNYFKNTTSINWLIIILIIINLGLLTFLIIQYNSNKEILKSQEIRQQHVAKFMHNQLNLSTEQQNLFKESGHSYFEAMRNISKDAKNTKKELYKEIFKKEPNPEKIEALIELLGKKHSELEKAQFEHFYELKKVCNPEQEEQLEEIMNEMIEMMENRHHQGQMHRGQRKFRNHN